MVNSSTSKSYSNQEIVFNLENSTCRNIIGTQKASNKLSALSQMSSQTLSDLSNALKNSIDKDIAESAKQANTGLNLGQVNTDIMDQVVSDYLNNNIKNEISTSISNIISNTTKSSQKIIINAKNMPKCDNAIADQDMIIEQISSNFATNIVKNALTNVAENEDVQKLKQESDQKNAGISLFGGLILLLIIGVCMFFWKTVMKYIIPIIMILVGYGIYYFQSIDQKYSMYAMIIIEVLLFIFEIYCIMTSRKMPATSNLPAMPKIPKEVNISIKKVD
jgi:hypothetical protein